jgi:hypothetical protein
MTAADVDAIKANSATIQSGLKLETLPRGSIFYAGQHHEPKPSHAAHKLEILFVGLWQITDIKRRT